CSGTPMRNLNSVPDAGMLIPFAFAHSACLEKSAVEGYNTDLPELSQPAGLLITFMFDSTNTPCIRLELLHVAHNGLLMTCSKPTISATTRYTGTKAPVVVV